MSTAAIASPKKGAVQASQAAQEGSGPRPPQGDPTVTLPDNEALVMKITGVSCDDRSELLIRVRAGLPARAIKKLEVAYDATTTVIARCLLIPTSTLRRRVQNNGRLSVDESDRVVRFARLKDLSLEMMRGDNAKAVEWLRTPRDILGGETPMEHASTEIGAREVEDLIGRIRHGVFS